MTDLRQAAQQALDALKSAAIFVDSFRGQKATQDAITALRAALEQQAEPVGEVDAIGLNETDFHVSFTRPMPLGTKLYTTPPQRKELSASEILNMMPSTIPAEYDGELMEFARAVEAKTKEQP